MTFKKIGMGIALYVLLALFGSISGQNICPDSRDLFDGRETCFAVVSTNVDWFEERKSNESAFIIANNYCHSIGKQVGVIRNNHQHNIIANFSEINQLERIVIGLRRQQTLWKWIGEDAFLPLSNQGCYKQFAEYSVSLKQVKDRDQCIAHCLTNPQNLFAAVVGTENDCLCSSNFHWESPSGQCTTSCNGSSYLCGGVEAASVVQLTLPRRVNNSISNRQRAFDKWHPTEPSSSAGNCGLFLNNDRNNYWFAEDCRKKFPYLCQFQYPNQPDLNAYARYQWLNDDVFVLMETQPLSFFEANFQCKRIGGQLATLNTAQKQILIEELMTSRPIFQPGGYRFWIGLTSYDFSIRNLISSLMLKICFFCSLA